MQSFNNKHIIITGGSRGIGFAIAKAFHTNGAEVLLIARDKDELSEARKKLSSKTAAHMLSFDVSVPDAKRKIQSFIENKWHGLVDVLVNTAGIYGPKGFLEENDTALWRKTFEVNVFGTMEMCVAVLPYMKKTKRGRIITFSGGGDGAFPRFTAYSSSKGAVARFTESLAAETKDFGITVNAIAPGAVNTALMEEVLKAGPQKVGEDFYKKSLEQRASGGTSPEQAAELVLFLASDEAGFLSGKIFSAVHDDWKNFYKHSSEISKSDVYNVRRIKPKDRGYEW